MNPYRLHSPALGMVCVSLVSMILAASASPVYGSPPSLRLSTLDGLWPCKLQSSPIHLSVTGNHATPRYCAKQASFLDDLRDDISYLLGEPDFCAVMGALAIGPRIFDSAFKNESPELSEMWAASNFADQFFEFGDGMGSAVFPLSASAICYSVGKLRHLSTPESFGRTLLRAQAINGLITVSLKRVINRMRPDGTRYSYPSGHTSTAFTTAGVIHHHLGPLWGLPAHLAAIYVGLSRLQENKHYLTDVIGGAILGSYVAYKVTHRRGKTSSHSLSLFVNGQDFGARLAVRF